MSKLRNTPSAPQRRRNTFTASAFAAGSLVASLLAACSSDAHNVVAPDAAAKAPAAYAGTYSSGSYSGSYGTTMPSAPYNTTDAAQQLGWSSLNSLLGTFHTQTGDAQSGARLAEVMQCSNYQQSVSTTKTVNPSSYQQTMTVGRATVTFPAGSVPSTVTIQATATMNQNGVKLDFLPHGYKFTKAIQVDVGYSGCSLRFSSPLNFYYLNDQGGIIQTMPSNDDRSQTVIHALTDHFSGYLVAWS